ncbi:hypothetical protein CPB84DRAFT_1851026 [Gymnopilus junonius]|uniref:EF-hand domain-containing protein n=1 Tax=Gymnopilus junonius TaxID=109634 RepID=A0A9P5NFI8_GYMJU|nr:hypothetical protein CPB84DRAFT_1851026 [Gymnopilus junonius]
MSGLSIKVDAPEPTAVDYSPYDAPPTPDPYTYEVTATLAAPSISSRSKTLKLDSTSKNKDGSSEENIGTKLDDLLDSFMNGADAVLNELSILGNAHPILAIAIFAFHEVVKLDIARRDNNKKVLVVVMQMQSMMGPMFQLRNLSRDHMPEEERVFHEGRLKELIEVITRNIKECRSDIAHFLGKKFMFKLVLAKGYESKFATHMEVFALRRTELQSIISEYLAIGMSSASVALAEVGKKLNVMDSKLDMITSKLFRNLDTRREREVFDFMRQNGGPEKCVNDLDLLPKLIAKAGESHSMAGNSAIYDQKSLEDLQKQLREALSEDLDKVLEKHYLRFEKILQVQNNNLKSMSTYLEDQGILMHVHATKLGKILDTVTTIMVMEEGKVQTKAVKLKDPEIQRVWNQMNLTSSSVKAKVFVLTFRDHIRHDNSVAGTPLLNKMALPGDEEADSNTLQPSSQNVSDKESDEWVLDYIDVAYVQPIVEAMDEDGSGFISVKEANSFALARPKGLSLLHWMAYWAAGWHINLANYKKEIYSLLLEMHSLLPSIHVANRKLVHDYLDHDSLRRVEAMLRSIKPLPDTGRKDPKLGEIANLVASYQLQRLEKNLTDMGYFIESGMDATTIGGSARIETWILPLVLLLIRRQLKVIYLAKAVVLDNEEFDAHRTSLTSLFVVFDERLDNVEVHQAWHVQVVQPHDTSILSKPVGSPLPYTELDVSRLEDMVYEHVPHTIEGEWSGLTISDDGGWRDAFSCVIHSFSGNAFSGKGEGFFGIMNITNGKLAAKEDPVDGRIEVTFDIPELSRACRGWYDPKKELIEGKFSWTTDENKEVVEEEEALNEPQGNINPVEKDVEQEAAVKPGDNEAAQDEHGSSKETDASGSVTGNLETEAAPVLKSGSEYTPDNDAPMSQEEIRAGGKFYLRRTPHDVFRFRYLLDGPGYVPCWDIWPIARKRWAFAIEAILFQTRQRMGSRKAFLEALAERRKWLTYGQRYALTDSSNLSGWFRYEELSDAEWEEYKIMMWNVDPTLARLYEATSLYFMNRGKWSVGLYYCDKCGKSLAFTRYLCIVCIEDDLSHSIDLCSNCFDKPDVLHAQDYTHIPSHSLLRSQQYIHNFEVKTLLAESRRISERSKKIFGALEAKSKETKERRSRKAPKGKIARSQTTEQDHTNTTNEVDEPAQTCACCAKPVSTPCWVCVSCYPLTFICNSCDQRSESVVQPGRNHSREHHLLRIHDSIEVKPVKTNDMERQLDEINSNISALEAQVKSQREEAKEMKDVVNGVAKTMGVQDEGSLTLDSDDDEFDRMSLGVDPASAEAEVGEGGMPMSEKQTSDSDISENPIIGAEERGPARPPNNNRGTSRSQMDIMARISMLETKVGGLEQNIKLSTKDTLHSERRSMPWKRKLTVNLKPSLHTCNSFYHLQHFEI